MHPAFSVIFFTVASGLGYGLWVALAARLLQGFETPLSTTLAALLIGGVLVTAGLCSSLLHLGQPRRAWRAFSQWRTSWLSREGVAAVASFAPAIALAVAAWNGASPGWVRGLALATILAAVATTVCTAMIYASLKPVPAWRHRSVPIAYVLLAGYTGGLAFAALRAAAGAGIDREGVLLAAVVAVALWWLKARYWRDIDAPLPLPRAAAIGLPRDRNVRVFERPHTEANYLLKEMGYVLARRHAAKLRVLAMGLLAVVPTLLLLPVALVPGLDSLPWLVGASVSALLGAFVERWLFFAEARHLVTLYY